MHFFKLIYFKPLKQEFERQKEQKDDPFQRRKGFPTLVAAVCLNFEHFLQIDPNLFLIIFKKSIKKLSSQDPKSAEPNKEDDTQTEKSEKTDSLKKNVSLFLFNFLI